MRLRQDASSSGGTAAAGGVFSDDQSDERRRSDDTLPVWFKEEIESNRRPASEGNKGTSYPAGPGRESGRWGYSIDARSLPSSRACLHFSFPSSS